MTEPIATELLDREVAVFTRYLIGTTASAYICACYRDGHSTIPYRGLGTTTKFDPMLLTIARTGQAGVRLADAYARWFLPSGVLRQKLVLLLAILENAPTSSAATTRATLGSRTAVLAKICGATASGVAAIVAGLLILGPLHLVTTLVMPKHPSLDTHD